MGAAVRVRESCVCVVCGSERCRPVDLHHARARKGECPYLVAQFRDKGGEEVECCERGYGGQREGRDVWVIIRMVLHGSSCIREFVKELGIRFRQT